MTDTLEFTEGYNDFFRGCGDMNPYDFETAEYNRYNEGYFKAIEDAEYSDSVS